MITGSHVESLGKFWDGSILIGRRFVPLAGTCEHGSGGELRFVVGQLVVEADYQLCVGHTALMQDRDLDT